MTNHEFINRLRSLHNIDGVLLPELTEGEQVRFENDPVNFLMKANDTQADAIMREVEKRQKPTEVDIPISVELVAALQEVLDAWNSLPTGNYPLRTVDKWLVEKMAPAFVSARAALTKLERPAS
jgi:hypothetical protein